MCWYSGLDANYIRYHFLQEHRFWFCFVAASAPSILRGQAGPGGGLSGRRLAMSPGAPLEEAASCC